jgi:delta 1-pyrroline-5-carboxylate dehydrogenase
MRANTALTRSETKSIQLNHSHNANVRGILDAFGLTAGSTVSGVAYGGGFTSAPTGEALETHDPTTGEVLAYVKTAGHPDVSRVAAEAAKAFERWRLVPPPQRGEIVRRLSDAFRRRKEDLALLISLENGKILSEARGEVQEVIDICDLAVGQSRQLFGHVIASERRDHQLLEQWHPLGVVGIISAFNFPVAVPGWGWALALVCGDTIVWKPSSLTPLVSIAVQQIFHEVTGGTEAEGAFSLVIGKGGVVGEALLSDTVGPRDPRAWRQQRSGRNGRRGPKPCYPSGSFRRRRNRRSAVHDHPAANTASSDPRALPRAFDSRLPDGSDRRPA